MRTPSFSVSRGVSHAACLREAIDHGYVPSRPRCHRGASHSKRSDRYKCQNQMSPVDKRLSRATDTVDPRSRACLQAVQRAGDRCAVWHLARRRANSPSDQRLDAARPGCRVDSWLLRRAGSEARSARRLRGEPWINVDIWVDNSRPADPRIRRSFHPIFHPIYWRDSPGRSGTVSD